jgi:hypothetical protein
MKKIILIIVIGLFYYNVSSQEIGVRFGEFAGNNVAIDGVFAWKTSRVHADVTFGDGVGIDALYDFIVQPFDGADNLYYYIGAGVTTYFGDDFQLGAVAEAGLEYRFPTVPIALGIDYRPSFIIVEETDFDFGGFGFNARYVFN